MKKFLSAIMAIGMTAAAFAADTIYRGDSTDAKDVICYFQGGKFYADAARKEVLYSHPGNMVSREATAKADNCIYRLMNDKIFKGYSNKPEDCIATIVPVKEVKGDVVVAKIYPGFVMVRDKVENRIKGGTELTSYNVTREGGVNVEDIPVLYTVADNKIFKGDSTNPEDCLLTFTGSFNSSRLLFMAVELTKPAE